MYGISAWFVETTKTGTIHRNLPTFFLDCNVQGFLDESGAEKIARDILGERPNCTLYIHVVEVGFVSCASHANKEADKKLRAK